MNIKNRSHKFNISRPRSRHGHKYSECKKCLSMMMLICIKQHLSNIWSSAHEKIKEHWGWVGKKKQKREWTCLNKLTKLIRSEMEKNIFLMPPTLQVLKKRLLNK